MVNLAVKRLKKTKEGTKIRKTKGLGAKTGERVGENMAVNGLKGYMVTWVDE